MAEEHAVSIRLLKEELFRWTGHELLEPANQFCKHCGNAMFVKEQSSKKCTGNKDNSS